MGELVFIGPTTKFANAIILGYVKWFWGSQQNASHPKDI